MPTAQIEFITGSKYTFEVYPSALLRSDFSNVEVLGVLSESMARKFSPTRENHANYFPYLPAGTPNDPTAYNYISVRTQSGVEVILGIAWIKPESVRTAGWQTIVATIQTSKPDAINRIKNALASNDFNDVTLEVH